MSAQTLKLNLQKTHARVNGEVVKLHELGSPIVGDWPDAAVNKTFNETIVLIDGYLYTTEM